MNAKKQEPDPQPRHGIVELVANRENQPPGSAAVSARRRVFGFEPGIQYGVT